MISKTIKNIVVKAVELKDKYITMPELVVNYVAIFTQTDEEYEKLLEEVVYLGVIVKNTPTGYVFQIKPVKTIAGKVELLKIRKPETGKIEKGCADFTIPDFEKFKKEYLGKNGFHEIEKEDCELIGLSEEGSEVRVYFENPPLIVQLQGN